MSRNTLKWGRVILLWNINFNTVFPRNFFASLISFLLHTKKVHSTFSIDLFHTKMANARFQPPMEDFNWLPLHTSDCKLPWHVGKVIRDVPQTDSHTNRQTDEQAETGAGWRWGRVDSWQKTDISSSRRQVVLVPFITLSYTQTDILVYTVFPRIVRTLK